MLELQIVLTVKFPKSNKSAESIHIVNILAANERYAYAFVVSLRYVRRRYYRVSRISVCFIQHR